MPASIFNNHHLVFIPETMYYYDPSYGLKHETLEDIDALLSGFWQACEFGLVFQINPPGVQIKEKRKRITSQYQVVSKSFNGDI